MDDGRRHHAGACLGGGRRRGRPAHDHPLLGDRQQVVPGPVDDEAGGELRQHVGEDDGQQHEHLLLHRIDRRLRVELLLQELSEAHHDRPGADHQQRDRQERDVRRGERQQAEEVDEGGGVGRREIVDPAVERRVAHLDGDVEHLIEREEHRDLDEDRQAAGHGIGADALVERHHLLVEPRLVLAEALAQLLHLRLQRLHLAHRAVGFVGEREEQPLDAQCEQQDGEAEAAGRVVEDARGEEVERQEDRLGDPIEQAEIDRPVEARDGERALVVVEKMHFLGAGEEPVLGAERAMRRHQLLAAVEIGLEDVAMALAIISHLRGDGRLLRRDEGGEPVFVGEAEPAAGGGIDHRAFLHIGIVIFVRRRPPSAVMQRAVEHGERAFMQQIRRGGRRLADAHDAAKGGERHRLAGAVLDRLGDGEHVIVVDGVTALEAQALAIVPGEIDRLLRREQFARGGPARLGPGSFTAEPSGGVQPKSA